VAALSELRRSNSFADRFATGAFFWNALAVVVLAVLLARWTWIWFAPHTPNLLPLAEKAAPDVAGHLFGVSAAATGRVNLALTGVFTGRNGFAVFEVDGGRQLAVPLGGEIAPGMKLLEAASDHVIVGDSGARQRVDLRGAAATR
jgi:general secretion pathway protein C